MSGFILGSFATFGIVNYMFDLKKKKPTDEDISNNDANDDEEVDAELGLSTRNVQDSPAGGRSKFDKNVTQTILKTSAYATVSNMERVGFLSDVVAQLWSYIRVAGADTIRTSVEPLFKEMLPGPLATLHFTDIDLGMVPIKLDNVVVHEHKNGVVQFDLDLIWHTDCNISLKADYMGAFGVKGIKLQGRMSFLMKPLTTKASIVSGIQFGFINPPDLHISFSGMAKFADFKIVSTRIEAVLQDSLSILVLPNRISTRLDPACGFFDLYEPPVGIARVTIIEGRGFQIEQKRYGKPDVPDVYCNVSLGRRTWKTSTIQNNLTPTWNECGDFLLSDKDQILRIHAWDEDKGAMDADDDLGKCQVSVGEILLSGKTIELELQEKDKGTDAFVRVHCDIFEFTPSLDSFVANSSSNAFCGILVILVTQAFDLPVAMSEASSCAKIEFKAQEFVTGVVTECPGIDALNPVFDAVYQIPLSRDMVDSEDSAITFTLMNDISVVGTFVVSQSDLKQAPEKTITDRRKIGERGASLEFQVRLRGIRQTNSSLAQKHGSSHHDHLVNSPIKSSSDSGKTLDQAPSRKIRIIVYKGHGFKIQKRRGFRKEDIPDVYCLIKYGSSPTVWRTSTIKNSTEPIWNESSEYTLSSHSQIINLEALDEDKGVRDPDDPLGGARIAVGKILLAGGSLDVELIDKGTPTGSFITLRVNLVDE